MSNPDAAIDPDPAAAAPGTPAPPGAWRVWSAAVRKVLGLLAVAVVGASIGWSLAPPTTMTVGPLEVAVDPQLRSGPSTVLELPPVGDVSFDSHRGPLALDLSVRSIDLTVAEELIGSPDQVRDLQESAPDAATRAVVLGVLLAIGCATAGAAAAGLLTFRRPRRALQCAAAVLVPLLGCAALAGVSFDPRQLGQPTFTGLLTRAPYVLQQGLSAVDRLESYRSGVQDLTRAVTTLYSTANQLPAAAPTTGAGVTTVLHVSDIHLNPQSFDLIRTLVQQFGVQAVIDTGDITTWGTGLESQTLAPIADLGVPYVFVRGNHDSPETAAAVAAMPNAVVLDDTVTEVAGLRIAGIGDPTFTPDGEVASSAEVEAATAELARTVSASRAAGQPVDIALVHNPSEVEPLLGEVPLVLAGHMHTRAVRLDRSGTRVMVEGSTGGAGVSVGALNRLEQGTPLPLEATLLYFADDPATATGGETGNAGSVDSGPVDTGPTDTGPAPAGEPAGAGSPGGGAGSSTGGLVPTASGSGAGVPLGSGAHLVAYDEVRVGGLGLASVSLQRTTIGPDEEPDEQPLPDVTPVDRATSPAPEATTESIPPGQTVEPTGTP